MDQNKAPAPERRGHPYEGEYRVEGNTLTRNDGKQLVVCTRTTTTGAKSSTFLVDASTPARDYVSSVWDNQFEYRGIRYGINWTTAGAEITALYRVIRQR